MRQGRKGYFSMWRHCTICEMRINERVLLSYGNDERYYERSLILLTLGDHDRTVSTLDDRLGLSPGNKLSVSTPWTMNVLHWNTHGLLWLADQ